MIEAQRMLKSSPRDDVERFSDGDAMGERIREWLDTPEGTMAHHPAWGLMEMAIARKLPIDVENIILKGVNVVVMDIDLCRIEILHQFGFQAEEIRL